MTVSRPHYTASIAGNDAPLIGERAEMRGRTGMQGGDEIPEHQRRTTRPGMGTLVDELPEIGWHCGRRHVGPAPPELHCPREPGKLSAFTHASSRPATMRRPSASAPRRTGAAHWKTAMRTPVRRGSRRLRLAKRHAARRNDAARDAHVRRYARPRSSPATMRRSSANAPQRAGSPQRHARGERRD
jgi:hypothetical protein